MNAISCECKSLATGLTFKKNCLTDIQVQNTCNKQQKNKHVDRWLKQIVQEIHAKVNRHDQFFLFAGAFDKSSSADDEGATETKNL